MKRVAVVATALAGAAHFGASVGLDSKPPETDLDKLADNIEREAEFLAQHSHTAALIVDFFTRLDAGIKRHTDNYVDLKIVLAAVLREGQLTIRANRVGSDTTAGRIVRLIDSAPVGDTRMRNHAETLADRLVMPTLGLAVGSAALTADFNRFLIWSSSITATAYASPRRPPFCPR